MLTHFYHSGVQFVVNHLSIFEEIFLFPDENQARGLTLHVLCHVTSPRDGLAAKGKGTNPS